MSASALEAPKTAATGRRLPALSGPLLGLMIVLGLFVVLIGLKGGTSELVKFASLRNLQVLVQEGTVRGVVALGMLLIIVSGGIDLSVGSVVALVTVVTMQIYSLQFHHSHSQALATLLAVPAGIAVGGVCGLVNGLVITRLRVTPFVATLGMYGMARGLAYWVSGRTQLAFPRNGRPHWVDALAVVHPSGTLFNPGFWSLVALAVAVAVLLRYTVLGRYCYAIGSNEAAARLCGVAVERYKVAIYTVAGLLTGWAGILFFARGGAGDPSGGKELELDVIAAVVIGGASLTGGQGTVPGALLGVLILEVLRNGVNTFEVPVEVQYILMGAIIIANTALSQWRRRQDIKA
jgi:ribose transport system permease protein